MIERDLSKLRFLHTRVSRGETLRIEDIDFLIMKKAEIISILHGIDEALDIITKKEEYR